MREKEAAGQRSCETLQSQKKKIYSSRHVLWKMARRHRKQFSIPFVAVTGSVGKTTTKDMVAAVLGTRFKVHKTGGNFNNEIGAPLTLLGLEQKHQVSVLELGMGHAGDIDVLGRLVEPDIVLITNIGDAHIGNLGSRENIFRAKCEILPHLKKDGLVILNGDDPLLLTLKGKLPQRTVFVGSGEGLDYTALDVNSSGAASLDCRIKTPRNQFRAEIPALGRHMIYPALMAAAVGEALGLNPDEIVRGIGSFLPYNMRMNIVRCKGDIVILDDTYNANPQSMQAAAAVLGDVGQNRRKVAVVGDMMELGADSERFHRAVGDCFIRSGADRLIAVGESSRFIAEGAKDAGLEQTDYFPSLNEAKDALLRELRPGVTILVKASRALAFEEIVSFLLANVPG